MNRKVIFGILVAVALLTFFGIINWKTIDLNQFANDVREWIKGLL